MGGRMQLAPLLKIGRGVTCIIGGGGKTTLMYTLAQELSARGSVIVTTTTHILPPEDMTILTDPDEASVAAALAKERIVCVGSPTAEGKLKESTLSADTLARLADFVLIEADGSRHLPLKAHREDEPCVPNAAQRVVLVIGADGFGQPIGDVCHRSDLYAELAEAKVSDAVTPQIAAHVIRAEGYGDRVFINKTETPERYAFAQQLAAELDCPVIAGSLREGIFVCLH